MKRVIHPFYHGPLLLLRHFENAMTLDISMGGSTNTVLHLLAASYEGNVGFTMDDIDRLSRKVPVFVRLLQQNLMFIWKMYTERAV